MLIRTRLASANISLEARVPTKDRPIPTEESVSFELLPADDDQHLDLDTGEAFQNYGFARLDKKEKKLISAIMVICEAQELAAQPRLMRGPAAGTEAGMVGDSYYKHNYMSYFDEATTVDDYSPSSIYLNVYIDPKAFRELVENIRSDLFPEVISIYLVDDPSGFFTDTTKPKRTWPIEFGSEPDGSGMIWHNKDKEHQRIPIERVSFHYAVGEPRYDEKHRFVRMQSTTPTDRINEQIALIQTSLAELLKYSRWIPIGVVALAIIAVILIIKH